jgi:predicted nucleic acid-binding protein
MAPTFVIDTSVILAWFNPNEQSEYADRILDCLNKEIAIVPQLCCLEVNNVFRTFLKKGTLGEFEVNKALRSISSLPIMLDKTSLSFQMPLLLSLARENDLTIYAACYLELAVRLNIPLATLDQHLLQAMEKTKTLRKTSV